MSKKVKPERACRECGHPMRYETRDDRVEYQGKSRTVKTTAWWCTSCGESVQDGPALQAAERAFVELRAEVDGVLLPEEVAERRRRLNISQREAGRLLGGGERAFQKYESGQVPVSIPMRNLLVLLGNDPTRLDELRAGRKTTTKKLLKRAPQRAHSARASATRR